MNNDLYFIPIIAEALRQKDPEGALRRAFDRIKLLGEQQPYVIGFEQFESFMAIVEAKRSTDHAGLSEANMVSTFLADLATDMFEGSEDERQKALSLIRSQPQLRREYDTLVGEIQWLNRRPAGISITIFRENREFDLVLYEKIPDSKTVEDISPGHYRVTFTTGRLIWEGEFTERDLLWTRAFPGKPLRLAADTVQEKDRPTREIITLDGEMVIRVFAGIESGRIEITIKPSGGPL